jgi:TonB-linked SusC/RagA family outer membrane protein
MKRLTVFYLVYVTAAVISVFPGMVAMAQNESPAQTTGPVISGVITDGKAPLEHVSVYEKDVTSNGTLTDQDGKFRLIWKGPSHILVITRIGFLAQELVVKGSVPLRVVMKNDVRGMDEVVVVGYGQTKKITLTGAVSSITGQEIRQSPSASLQNTLVGRLPGLFSEQRGGQPGADAASIQIRGVSSYTSTTTPLIMVDDIEFDAGQLSQIDPNEVESLSILKDASTTAVYGIRGSNGVIIIKTRRGQAGKPQLTVRNETGLQMPTQKLQVNDPYTTLELLKEFELGSGANPVADYPQFFSGNNMEYYRNNSDPYGHPYVDWWNVLLKKVSMMNRTSFDISGGSNMVKYFISLGYLTQGGIYKDFTKGQGYNGNYFYNRYNFRSNIDINPTKTLAIRMDLSGRFGVTNSPNDKGWNGGAGTFQYLWNGQLSGFGYPVYNPNGTLANTPAAITSTGTKPNPVANLTYSGYSRSNDNNFNLVTSATQKLDFVTRGLSVNALISLASDFTYINSLTRNSSQILTYYYNTNTKVYSPATTNLYRMGPLTRGGMPTGSSQLLNMQASLNYARSFGNHNISALALLNQNTNTRDTINAANVVAPLTPINYRGYTGKVSYNYKYKYLLDLSGAYNGSDRFGNGKKYGLFPAISAGWNISEEPFFKNHVGFVDALKIRGSYGLVGNDNIGGYQYLYQQVYGGGASTGYNFGTVSNPVGVVTEQSLGNSNVTWEKVRKTDIGIDLRMLQGAVTITADYFHDYRYDILTTRGTVPSDFGATLPPVNLGKVVNGGYELDIKYNGRSGKLTYYVDAQISYARNKVLYMDEPSKAYPWLTQTGKSIGQQFGYKWTGAYYQSIQDIYNSPLITTGVPLTNVFPGGLKLADLNKDGVIDQNDMTALGTNLPAYTGGMSFGISYKGFDASVLFQGAFDYIINIQRGVLDYFERPANISVPFNLGRWTPENAAHATFPSLYGGVTNQQPSSFWYRKGDYIRFKNFELGYTINTGFVKRMHLRNVRVYANGYNMGLIYTALPVFIDPESYFSSSSGEYPQQRIINFGLQVGL